MEHGVHVRAREDNRPRDPPIHLIQVHILLNHYLHDHAHVQDDVRPCSTLRQHEDDKIHVPRTPELDEGVGVNGGTLREVGVVVVREGDYVAPKLQRGDGDHVHTRDHTRDHKRHIQKMREIQSWIHYPQDVPHNCALEKDSWEGIIQPQRNQTSPIYP